MALVSIDINIGGEAQYARAFTALASEVTNLKTPLGEAAELLKHSTGKNFLSEGVYGTGGRWKPLNPEYEAWKQQHYPGRPIMVRTGELRNALLVRGVRELTGRRLVYGVSGSAEKYAHYHQTGEGKMPQRKIVALTQQDRRGIDRIFATWLNHKRRGGVL